MGLRSLSRQLIYFPDASPVPPAGQVLPEAEDLTLRTADGLDLGAWLVPPRGEDRATAVLVAPGNGGNRLGRVDTAKALSRRGFTVLLLDYRGYGGNPGSPSEEGLARDADAAVEALQQRGFGPEATLYFGESLGTGVVAALAQRQPPAGMLLRSPFTSLADVGAHHYPWLPVRTVLEDRFPVLEHVEDSEVPLVVVYGTADDVVPAPQSAQVAAAAPRLVDEVVFEGAGHNDAVMFGPRVAEAVVVLAEATQKPPPGTTTEP